LKFTVYPVSASWPESRQHMIIHATAVLMKYGVRWEPGDGKNEFQTGEAHGKRFFALYLPQKQVAATPQPSGTMRRQSGNARNVDEVVAAHLKSTKPPRRWWQLWK
jgi:hypothetical protein